MIGDFFRNLFGPGEEVRQLREEVESLKAAAASPGSAFHSEGFGGVGSPVVSLGAAREQLANFKGWVYSAIRPIAQRIAGQSIKVGRRVKRRTPPSAKAAERVPYFVKAAGDGVEALTRHPLLTALADPNEIMVPWSLTYCTVAALELTGLSYWWLATGGERPLEIWPLPPSWVSPNRVGERFQSYEVRPAGRVSGEPFVLPAEEVVRFAYVNPADPFTVVSPLQTLATAVNADESMQVAQLRAFQQGIYPGLAVTMGRNPGVNGQPGNRPQLNDHQRAQIINAVKSAFQGIHRFGEPIILDGLIESVAPITRGPQEMAFLDSSKLTKSRIFQAFGVNPLIAGEIEGSNRAQAVVAEQSFLAHTVNPKIELLSQVMTGYFSWHFSDPSLVCWVEPAVADDEESDRADWQLLLRAGAITRNEIRAWKGLPPLAKGGDTLIAPQPAAGGNGTGGKGRRASGKADPQSNGHAGGRIIVPGG